MNNTCEVTTETFDAEVLRADLPVLVAFYSPWCASCRKMEPALNRLAAEFKGRIKFASVDVDNDSDLAERNNIAAVPTLLLFKDTRVLHQVVGLASLGWLQSVLEKMAGATEQQTEALAVS